jgi:two-component system NtrC family response regulator
MAKILIIDDDRQLCKMISRHVEYMGHEAACVFSLKEGLQEVTSGTFDVVLLDVRLPDGNGLDLLPKIREMAFSP